MNRLLPLLTDSEKGLGKLVVFFNHSSVHTSKRATPGCLAGLFGSCETSEDVPVEPNLPQDGGLKD